MRESIAGTIQKTEHREEPRTGPRIPGTTPQRFHRRRNAAKLAPVPHREGDAPIQSPNNAWACVPEGFRAGVSLPEPWEEIFGPLRGTDRGAPVAVGQIGQSLDGRIATPTGHSHYINGEAGLMHLHRLRALVDAVVVGTGTVLADDPQLTVRRVDGPSPARIAIDPQGRIPKDARLFADDGARRIVLTAEGSHPSAPSGVEIVALPRQDGGIAPAAMLAALAARGLRRVLIEGGANTVSRFLAAGCLDRLHIVVAPVILGAGPAGLALPPVARADEALRVPVRIHRLGDEVLFDCDLAQRSEDGSWRSGAGS